MIPCPMCGRDMVPSKQACDTCWFSLTPEQRTAHYHSLAMNSRPRLRPYRPYDSSNRRIETS